MTKVDTNHNCREANFSGWLNEGKLECYEFAVY